MRFSITLILSTTYGDLCPFYAKFRLEIHSRADRVSSISFNKVVTSQIVSEALGNVKAARAERYENIDFNHAEGGRTAISIDYFDIQEGRTALRQHLPKHGEIEFLKIGESTRVRFPGTERVSEFTEEILTEIEKITGSFLRTTIDLGTFNKLERTRFFKLLIDQLDGYKAINVKKVNLNRELFAVDFSDEASENNEDSGRHEEIETEDESAVEKNSTTMRKEAEKEVKAVLKKAILDGSGILRANELKVFLESGFFISRIVWIVQPKNKKNDAPMAELEALLENPAAGSGFKYMVRGIYSYKTANKIYATTKRKPKNIERENFLDKMETAAQTAYLMAQTEPPAGA